MNTFLKRLFWFVENIFRKNKMKEQIPSGFYCYTPIDIESSRWKVHIITCPFYKKFNKKIFCMLHGIGEQDIILLDDQCKICGINENFEFE